MEPRADAQVTATDIIGFAFCAIGLIAALAAALRVQPEFAAMLSDLGGSLPRLTVLCLKPWFPFIAPAFASAMVTMGVVSRSPPAIRAALVIGALVVLLLGAVVFVFGLYLPMREISAAIQ